MPNQDKPEPGSGTVALVLSFPRRIGRAFRVGTIRIQLLISFVLIALLLAIVISSIAITGSVLTGQQRAQDQLVSVAVLKEAEINAWVDSLQINLVLAIASPDTTRDTLILLQESSGSAPFEVAHDNLQDHFRHVIEQSGRFEELFMINLQGEVILSTDATQEGKLKNDRDYFQNGLNETVVTPPFYSVSLGRTSIVAARPIGDAQGQVVGVLAGRANLDTLDQIMGERAGLGTTGETYLVGTNYALLTANRFGEKDIYVRTVGASEAIAKKANGSTSYSNYRGEIVIGSYRWLPKLRVVLLAEQTQAEALSVIYATAGLNIGAALVSVLFAVIVSSFIAQRIGNPLADLAETATLIATGDLERTAKIDRRDEIGTLAQAFNSMTARLRDLISSLEQRVADRTRDLEQRSAYLEAAALVGRAVTSILETEQLIQQIVGLIREQFDPYYVGLFLVDEAGDGTGDQWAVLRASAGRTGHPLPATGFRLKVDDNSMTGWSIANAQARVAQDVRQDDKYMAVDALPDIRSEAILPLRSRGQVLGALTVQSDQLNAFDRATITALQTVADQVAVALDNARLFAEAEEALETTRRAYGELSREGWREILVTQPDLGFLSRRQDTIPAGDLWYPEMETALRTTQVTTDDQDSTRLAIPLKVGDQVIGVVGGRKADGSAWTPEEVELLGSLTDQLSLALDSARLYQDTQRRAGRERLLGEVTARMRETLDVDTVLKTAADEIYQALGLDEVVVRLTVEDTSNGEG